MIFSWSEKASSVHKQKQLIKKIKRQSNGWQAGKMNDQDQALTEISTPYREEYDAERKDCWNPLVKECDCPACGGFND